MRISYIIRVGLSGHGMDASKLRNSCICGNTRPYLECCGPYADADGRPADRAVDAEGSGGPEGTDAEAALYRAFRHGLHELSMALFPLRSLYQAYWEKLAREDYPHDLLMEDPDYARTVVEDFFWDHFVQYSDARPILRTARELEGKDLRLAHDLMQWSYAPLWFYRVVERDERTARLVNPGNLKTHVVRHGGRMPPAGSGVITRLLPFRGREYCGHALLPLAVSESGPEAEGAAARQEALFRAGCRELGLKPSVTLRPDVHCDEWRRHGGVFLALWRAEIYDAAVGRTSRAQGSSPPAAPAFRLAVKSRQAMLSALAGAGEIRAAGADQWELRYRHLRLARLEAKGGILLVTLADAAFRAHVRDWLGDRLAASVSPPEESETEPLPGDTAEAQDQWIHTPLDALNGQSPLQASGHDLGRRRLQMMLKDMIRQGRDVTSLRRQLGL